jgi:hypothetical protein
VKSVAGRAAEVDTEKLADLWDRGLPIMEIAVSLGCNYKRVQYVARAIGLRKRTQQDHAKGRQRNVEPTPQEIEEACREFVSRLSEAERCERRGGYLSR